MKDNLDLKTIINFVLEAKTKKSIKDYIWENMHNYTGDIVTDGDKGISYLPNTKNKRKEISQALLGKTLEVRPDPSSIYYNYLDRKYYLTKYIFVDEKKALDISYEILSFRNIKDLYRANNNNLIGVNLIDVPISKKAKKELDFTGAYVLRKDINLYPNAIAVDEIICEKKFYQKFNENNTFSNSKQKWPK